MKKAVIVFVMSLFALYGPASVAGQASANNHQEKERVIRRLDSRGRAVAPGRGEYREAQARYLDSSKGFVEGAHSKNSTVEAPEPAP